MEASLIFNKNLPIGNSVVTELFKRVFLIYIIIAILITVIHMVIEYSATKYQIKNEIKTLSGTIEDGVETALWYLHAEQIESIIDGIQGLAVVGSIVVENEYGSALYSTGNIKTDEIFQGNDGFYKVMADSFFVQVTYLEFENKHVGFLKIYSNPKAVYQRVKIGFALILINSLIKSTVLWLLFVLLSRKLIRQPLSDLTRLVSSVDTSFREGLIGSGVSDSDEKENEITVLKNAFKSMLNQLAINHELLKEHADELENKVLERTSTIENREQKLRQAYRELELIRQRELNIIEAKSCFMADISHELRTPLAVIKLQLEAMESGIVPEGESCSVFARKIAQLERVVNDLSLISKADTGQLTLKYSKIEASPFLKEMVDPFVRIAAQSNISLKYISEKIEGVFLRADRERLSQVVNNLLNNSIKYTNSGGEIRMHVTFDCDKLLIILEDSTPGVSVENMSSLFDRLYRVESSRNRRTGGSGLGLAICQSIVQAHRGSILAFGSSLGGLKVVVSFPVLNEPQFNKPERLEVKL